MALPFLIAAAALFGYAASESLWGRDARRGLLDTPPGPFERAASAGLLGLTAWIALNWCLALTHALTRAGLLAGAALLASGATWRLATIPPAGGSTSPAAPGPRRWPALLFVVALAPAVVWAGYVLWRGTVIPPVNEDALIYHLPKAVLLSRAHAFQFFPAADSRISTFPVNYELLLSDVFLLTGGDAMTVVVSILAWLLFALSAAALAERWWGRGALHPIAAALLVAGTPVAILHSGSHKHDLLSAFMGVAAFLWFGRWTSEGSLAPAVFAFLALALGSGTKVPFGCVVVGVGVALAWALARHGDVRRRVDRRVLVAAAVIAAGGVLLLGGVAYLANWRHTGTLLGGNPTGAPPVILRRHPVLDLNSLWQFPYLLLTVPFSKEGAGVWVPWAHEYWLWSTTYVEQSHYGAAFTLLVVLTLALAITFRRQLPAPEGGRERRLVTLAALVSFFFPCVVPQLHASPFAFICRYLVFITAVVAAWSVAPLVILARSGKRGSALVAAGFLLASSALLVRNVVDVGLRDDFAPLEYVRALARSGARMTYYMPNRAASVIDQLAGPEDEVAFHAGHESWLYLAYGRNLTRKIDILSVPPGGGPVAIPKDAKFVAVDRLSNILWGAPGFDSLGRAWTFLWRGKPSDEDLAVFRQVLGDPRYRLVFHDPPRNQAVFARKDVFPALSRARARAAASK